MKAELERNAEKFDNAVEKFCNEHDLIATLNNQREKVAKDEIEKLKQRKEFCLKVRNGNKMSKVFKMRLYRNSILIKKRAS